MSQRPLPWHIDPVKLVEQKTILKGQLLLNDMPRLSSCVIASNPEAGDPSAASHTFTVDLDFFKDEEGLQVISGEICGEVDLECQRCLGLINLKLKVPVALAVATNHQAAEKLPERYHALIVDKSPVSLLTMVEDELLLALPTIAYHEEGQCSTLDYSKTDKQNPSLEPKPGPFDVLADLKK